MAILTRGERFKDARIVFNRNGKQTLREVEQATGVNKAKIQALEDDEKSRSVGYEDIAALARHYGVTTDYLLSLTDDPKPKPSAVDELGLSASAVKRILQIKNNSGMNDYIGICDEILSSPLFEKIVWDLRCLASAAIADDIYYRSLSRFRQKNPEESELDYFERNFVDKEAFYCKLNDIADDMQFNVNSHIAGYLRYMVKLDQANEDALNALDTFIIDGIGPEVVCPALRTGINDLFDALVKDLIGAEKRKFYTQQTEE